MKQSFASLTAVLLIAAATISCKKENAPDPNAGFSEEIKKLIPAEVIDVMRKNGMTIYEGKTPPRIEGIYLFSENILSGSSIEKDVIGKKYADYRFKFYEQDAATLSLKTSYKGYSSNSGNLVDEAEGRGSLISGNNNFFTVFSEDKGQNAKGATYTNLVVYSGEHTPSGIKNLQYAIYLKEKNDPNNTLIAVGSTRVFKDKDGISETRNSLRISAEKLLQNEYPQLPSKGSADQ